MLTLLLAWTVAQAAPCPDYVAAIDQSEAAIRGNHIEALHTQMEEVRRGLACGPILDNPILQARFWLARAVLLDAYGDVDGADDALYAAWRANPAAAVGHLPSILRARYARVVDRVTDEAAFRLSPLPEPGSVIYVDGVALHVVGEGELEALSHVRTQAGLHIVQVTPDAASLNALAARVRNLQADRISEFNIHEQDLLGRPPDELTLPRDLSRPAGGCNASSR